MNIVLEGPDNSGKSTLARYLGERLQRPVIHSEGPDKYPGEIDERVRRYERFENVLFDRHPCVSQAIYGRKRASAQLVHTDLIIRFYMSRPVFVYCREWQGLDGHVVKEHDTEEHLKSIAENHEWIVRQYERWAIDRAHVWYRVGDNMEQVYKMLKGL